jgi:hypothetical protein
MVRRIAYTHYPRRLVVSGRVGVSVLVVVAFKMAKNCTTVRVWRKQEKGERGWKLPVEVPMRRLRLLRGKEGRWRGLIQPTTVSLHISSLHPTQR